MRFLLSLLFLATLGLSAQDTQGPAPYDAAKEATYKASVVEVKTVEAGEMSTIALVIKVDDQQLTMNIGPDSFLKENKFSFAKGDELTVVGIKREGGKRISAREITKGKDKLVIRNKDGNIVWMNQN